MIRNGDKNLKFFLTRHAEEEEKMESLDVREDHPLIPPIDPISLPSRSL